MNVFLVLNDELQRERTFIDVVQAKLVEAGTGVERRQANVSRMGDELMILFGNNLVTYRSSDDGFSIDVSKLGEPGSISAVFDHSSDDYMDAGIISANWLIRGEFSSVMPE